MFFWPGSEASVRGVRPTEYRPYEPGVPFEKRLDVAANWLVNAHAAFSNETTTSTSTGVPSFHALYFEEPDGVGHAHGPFAAETAGAVRRVDDALGRLREKTGEHVWNRTNVVIVADHGMATVSPNRVVYLGDGACGLDFSKIAVTGGEVVMGIWGRTPDGKRPSPERGEHFDPAAIAQQVNGCHPHVKAWTKENVPDRFGYKNNRRVAPVVVAADVGWTLCAHKAAKMPGKGAQSGNAMSDPLNWATLHGNTACDRCNGTTECGAHGYDNEAPEMRAIFMARGPAFRKDGARLCRDAKGVSSALVGEAAHDSTGTPEMAMKWEKKTLAFSNIAVHAVITRAMGIDLDVAALADGLPPPNKNGDLLDDGLAKLLFSGDALAAWREYSAEKAMKKAAAAASPSTGEEAADEIEEYSTPRSGYALLSALVLVAVLAAMAGVWTVFLRHRAADAAVQLPSVPRVLSSWVAPWKVAAGWFSRGTKGAEATGDEHAYTRMNVELPEVGSGGAAKGDEGEGDV